MATVCISLYILSFLIARTTSIIKAEDLYRIEYCGKFLKGRNAV